MSPPPPTTPSSRSPAASALAHAPITHSMPMPENPAEEPDFLLLPDAPAVCIIESPPPDRRTLLLATTASARDLARRRLGAQPPEQHSARVDLRAICGGGCVHAIHVGSSLEAEAVYLHQARTRMPQVAQIASERWRAWFAHVDPDAEFPQWTKTNLMVGLVGKRKASSAIGPDTLPPGVFLGPLPDKDAAGRFIEAMIDAFDLCRFHNLLVQAPKAAACAYKEMGRCPAPCDGTETMESYRVRTRAAVTFMAAGELVPAITKATRAVVAEMEAGTSTPSPPSPTAAAHIKQIERLRTLRNASAFAHVGSLADAAWLLLLPSATPKRVSVALGHRGELLRVADVDPTDASAVRAARNAAAELVRTAKPLPKLGVTPESVDAIAILTRWLFLPEKKRRGDWFRLDLHSAARPLEDAALHRAAKSVLLRTKPGEPVIEAQELEGS